ncbi:hypothetical protein ACFV7Q_18090 [Streptomyces sp. NPDC059851]|uniref:hypothetical protein n=1 Tax=Streptomyces sp. NPDC059851 TaxID=3346971 RepID=UPI00364E55DB
MVGSVGSFSASPFILRESDLVGLVTTQAGPLASALGLKTFELPLDLPVLPFDIAWHPRHDAGPAHAWLRRCAREILPGRRPADPVPAPVPEPARAPAPVPAEPGRRTH